MSAASARGRAAALALATALVFISGWVEPAASEDAASGAGEAAIGRVSGHLTIMRQGLFGRLRKASDASGALIYLTGFTTAPPQAVVELAQQHERFVPRVLPVVAGQTVAFPNRDPIYHNVFSVSAAKPFDLGQYKQSDPPRRVTFERPGLVSVYCNIHPEMISYVAVLENAAFATTSADGAFEIAGAPPGEWQIHAWTPGAQRVSQAIRIGTEPVVGVALELRATQPIEPHVRKDGSPYPVEGYRSE